MPVGSTSRVFRAARVVAGEIARAWSDGLGNAPGFLRKGDTDVFPEMHEECGIFGVYGHAESANLTYLGLYALQHRGQESAGIASSDGEVITFHKEIDRKSTRLNSSHT